MEKTTTIAIMTAILAAPYKGDFTNRSYFAELATNLYDDVTKITRPLEGATVVGSDDLQDDEPESFDYPVSWLDVAIARGAKKSADGFYDAGELARVGVQLINGCPDCGATVGAHNSYKINEHSDYAFCAECASNRTGVEL